MGCDVMRNPAALTIKKDGIDVIFVNGKIASMTGEITRFSGPDGVYDQNKYNEALRAMLAGLGGPFEYRIDMLGQVHKGTIGADGGIS